VGTTPSSPAASGGGLTDNVAGLLAYLFWPVAVVFLLIEPYNKNKFIRFHCFQCLFLIGAWFVLWFAIIIIAMVPYIGWIISLLGWLVVGLGGMVVWILLMVKAYQNQMWKLPFIGELAAKQAGA
jgi:uncharacterized membrane protein